MLNLGTHCFLFSHTICLLPSSNNLQVPICGWRSQQFISCWSRIHPVLSEVYLSGAHISRQGEEYIQATKKGENVLGRQLKAVICQSSPHGSESAWHLTLGVHRFSRILISPASSSCSPSHHMPPHELHFGGQMDAQLIIEDPMSYHATACGITYGSQLFGLVGLVRFPAANFAVAHSKIVTLTFLLIADFLCLDFLLVYLDGGWGWKDYGRFEGGGFKHRKTLVERVFDVLSHWWFKFLY